MAWLLKNSKGEYIKRIDTANAKLEFTTDRKKAYNYSGLPGGGQWDADNQKYFIIYHFKKEFGDRVTTLKVVHEDIED